MPHDGPDTFADRLVNEGVDSYFTAREKLGDLATAPAVDQTPKPIEEPKPALVEVSGVGGRDIKTIDTTDPARKNLRDEQVKSYSTAPKPGDPGRASWETGIAQVQQTLHEKRT